MMNISWSHMFGHDIHLPADEYEIKDGVKHYSNWRYDDTNELVPSASKTTRKCPNCNKYPTKEGHDPCIANLPNVKYACCGHGKEQPYIAFDDGSVVRGEEAEKQFNELRESGGKVNALGEF